MRYPITLAVAVSLCQTANAQVAYSNITNINPVGFQQGPAVGGITRMVADDITPVIGGTVTNIVFSVANYNPLVVGARPLLRFYSDNSGVPGTFIAGFDLPARAFAFGGVTLVNVNIVPGSLIIPSSRFWAGMAFDNVGSPFADDGVLSRFSQGIYNPPTVGNSVNLAFETTAAGSFASSNPVGSVVSFGGGATANMGWQFTVAPVPEPTLSLLVAGLGVVGLQFIRRWTNSVS